MRSYLGVHSVCAQGLQLGFLYSVWLAESPSQCLLQFSFFLKLLLAFRLSRNQASYLDYGTYM